MKSGRFKNRLWLAAILTLSVNVFFCQAKSAEDSPSDNSGGQLVVGPLDEASSDPYWKYYEDCDRWGVDLTRSNHWSATRLHSESKKDGLGKSPRRAENSPFQTVKHVLPKSTGAKMTLVQSRLRFTKLTSAWAQLQGLVSKTFEQRVLPSIRFMEFVSVESATYPNYFLNQRPASARQRLEQLWGWSKAQTGLNQVFGDWIAKHNSAILLGKLVGERIRNLLSGVLQKSTGLFGLTSSTFKN